MIKEPIFIVGFMGSGKTTWGKKLSNALAIPFIDLDERIVSHTGISIPAYFEQYGETAFRTLEQRILQQVARQGAIVSTGGGTPCYYDNMDWMLAQGTVLYLHHSTKSLWNRLSQSDVRKRPALQGLKGDELLAFIDAKLAERTPYYERASIVVDQINTSLENLIQQIHAYTEIS